MALETILAAIADEAETEVERIADEASRRVDTILADADDRARDEQVRWEGSRDEETKQAVAGIVNRAQLEADRRVADAREDLFQEALGRLIDRIHEAVAGPDYPAIFRALLTEAGSVVPDQDAAILVRPADVELAELVARERGITGTVKGVLDCVGGLDVETGDGRSVRNTIDSRLLRSERPMRRLAVQVVPEMASGRPAT